MAIWGDGIDIGCVGSMDMRKNEETSGESGIIERRGIIFNNAW